jgi:hypothetical protein
MHTTTTLSINYSSPLRLAQSDVILAFGGWGDFERMGEEVVGLRWVL